MSKITEQNIGGVSTLYSPTRPVDLSGEFDMCLGLSPIYRDAYDNGLDSPCSSHESPKITTRPRRRKLDFEDKDDLFLLIEEDQYDAQANGWVLMCSTDDKDNADADGWVLMCSTDDKDVKNPLDKLPGIEELLNDQYDDEQIESIEKKRKCNSNKKMS